MNSAEELVKYIETEAIKKHAEFIRDFCKTHRNCTDCPFWGGVCWFRNIPSDWDFISRNTSNPVPYGLRDR